MFKCGNPRCNNLIPTADTNDWDYVVFGLCVCGSSCYEDMHRRGFGYVVRETYVPYLRLDPG